MDENKIIVSSDYTHNREQVERVILPLLVQRITSMRESVDAKYADSYTRFSGHRIQLEIEYFGRRGDDPFGDFAKWNIIEMHQTTKTETTQTSHFPVSP